MSMSSRLAPQPVGAPDDKTLLPNGSPRPTPKRAVPACDSCNSVMGSKLEQPISRAMGSTALQETSLAPVIRMWLTKILIGSMHCQAGLRSDLRDSRSPPQTDLSETMRSTEPLRQELMAFLTTSGQPHLHGRHSPGLRNGHIGKYTKRLLLPCAPPVPDDRAESGQSGGHPHHE